MEKEQLNKIVAQLEIMKDELEMTERHNIEYISVSEDYDQKGYCVYGISIQYRDDVKSGTFLLIDYVEKVANKTCQWFRYNPKRLFISNSYNRIQ